jgi:glycosyltransferase involved in cell wall biosynthesis
MRIAVLAPISWRTPPHHYGPWEQFASLLTEGLVARGHDVTLFATGDSQTSARLSAVVPHGWSYDQNIEPKVAECLHIAAVFERAEQFDIIHNGFDFLPLTYSELVKVPVVTTIHGFSSEQIVAVYARYNATGTYISISDADRHPSLRYEATIHHGINTDQFPHHASPGEALLFFGRIHPDKGTATAIEVARRVGRPLIIAGIIQDEEYFRTEIEPHIDGSTVQFVGSVGSGARAAMLGSAHALLHLIHFDEPFGFSVAEALTCGTPVVAFDRGSMRELIDDGVTGIVVDPLTGADGATRAVQRVGSLDRDEIRRRAILRFDHNRMVDAYLDVYRNILARRP